MTKKTVGPGENGMRQGIHILTGLLLVVIVASALRNSLMQMGLVALVAATFGVCMRWVRGVETQCHWECRSCGFWR